MAIVRLGRIHIMVLTISRILLKLSLILTVYPICPHITYIVAKLTEAIHKKHVKYDGNTIPTSC